MSVGLRHNQTIHTRAYDVRKFKRKKAHMDWSQQSNVCAWVNVVITRWRVFRLSQSSCRARVTNNCTSLLQISTNESILFRLFCTTAIYDSRKETLRENTLKKRKLRCLCETIGRWQPILTWARESHHTGEYSVGPLVSVEIKLSVKFTKGQGFGVNGKFLKN